MIDLETMSSNMDAAIGAIGATVFDPSGEPLKLTELDIDALAPDKFYMNIDLPSCLNAGLTASGSTIYWWLNQQPAARAALCYPRPVPISSALNQFKLWLTQNAVTHVWAHANFDLAILHTAFDKVHGTAVPWKYTNARDVRTIYDLAFGPGGPPNVPSEQKHNALYDAIRQAIGVQLCYAQLKH